MKVLISTLLVLSVFGVYYSKASVPASGCLFVKCFNGGTCAIGSEDRRWYCICPPGRTGTRCEKRIHDCSSQPCQNGGSCCENKNGYTCDCPAGFTGTHCETDIDECLSDPCQNGATCVDQINAYTCSCGEGLTGSHCENKIPGCHSNTCHNGGSCAESNDGTWYCICPKTYKGIKCQQRVNDCSSHPCQNGGSCCDKGNHYECSCLAGYTGTHCEIKSISPSSTFSVITSSSACPCLNGGFCKGPVCVCPIDYFGSYCEQKVCKCLNGGTCTLSSYCSCPFPYTGQYCEAHYCDVVKPACENGGTCEKQPNGYRCNCLPNYSGKRCETVISTSSLSSSVCSCPRGQHCVYGRCEYCPPGTYGPNCEFEENPCTRGNLCPAGKVCSKIYGDVYTCVKGTATEYSTERISTTSTFTVAVSSSACKCLNGGTCTLNSYCSCAFPYTGQYCESHYCDVSKVCWNGGTCKKEPHGYKCICRPNYIGKNCRIVNSISSSSSSEIISPSSTFSSILSSSACKCPRGQHCVSGQCKYCPIGTYGPNCEFEDNLCTVPGTCPAGESCSKIYADWYKCVKVSTAYSTGPLTTVVTTSSPSSTPVTLTTSSSSVTMTTSVCHCLNGGTCLPNGECYCPIGMGGPNCGYYVDYCLGRPCKNGGHCSDGRSSYICDCLSGFSGINCELGPTPSTSSPGSTPSTSVFSTTTQFFITSDHFTTQQTTTLTTTWSTSTPALSIARRGRGKRELKQDKGSNNEDNDMMKRICKQNELKARRIFSDKSFTTTNWKTLHPAIKAVLIDLVANDDHMRLSRTHAQIKKAVATNDLMKMSKIMVNRNLWKRVPMSRYWKRKQRMKKAVKNPWKSMVENNEVC